MLYVVGTIYHSVCDLPDNPIYIDCDVPGRHETNLKTNRATGPRMKNPGLNEDRFLGTTNLAWDNDVVIKHREGATIFEASKSYRVRVYTIHTLKNHIQLERVLFNL